VRRATIGILVAALVAAGPLVGQQSVAGGVLTYFVRQSTPTEANSQSGSWLGAEGQLALGRTTLRLQGVSGSLGGNPVRVDRDARLTTLSLRYRVTSWASLGVDAEAHRQASSVSVQVWRLFGPGATVKTGLGVEGLEARGDIAVFPVTGVVASRAISVGSRVEVGLAYLPPRVPLEIQFGYREESVSFPDAVNLRFGGLTAGLLLQLGPR
jgi:hypothetical protein